MPMQKHSVVNLTPILAVGLLVVSLTWADNMQKDAPSTAETRPSSQTTSSVQDTQSSEAQELVNEAVPVVQKMEADPHLRELMKQAKGLYIVPEFGRGALIVGARGGSGLVVVRQQEGWSDPAFYYFGAVSFGAQAGGSSGSVVFFLMSQRAVDLFKSTYKFSLNAEAGLAIINYSVNNQASWGKGDIVMWSDTAGAYVGATISVTDVNWDEDNNRAYYGENVDLPQILRGEVRNAGADKLKDVLSG